VNFAQLLRAIGVNVIVGISDAKVSADPQDVLATYSLGSCIGVAVYDPHARVGGLLHFQLPSAGADPNRGQDRPLMFADTGTNWLLKEVQSLGANQRRLRVRIAGAAQMLNDSGLFDIGRRNHAAIRKILWQYGLFIECEHIGGDKPRTMLLNMNNGELMIKSMGASLTV
jgi:chemotaxis protein CheD